MSLKPYNIGVLTEVSGKSNPTKVRFVISYRLSAKQGFASERSPQGITKNVACNNGAGFLLGCFFKI